MAFTFHHCSDTVRLLWEARTQHCHIVSWTLCARKTAAEPLTPDVGHLDWTWQCAGGRTQGSSWTHLIEGIGHKTDCLMIKDGSKQLLSCDKPDHNWSWLFFKTILLFMCWLHTYKLYSYFNKARPCNVSCTMYIFHTMYVFTVHVIL